jgi:hypothetical protein
MKIQESVQNLNDLSDDSTDEGQEASGLKIRTGLKAGLTVASTSLTSGTLSTGTVSTGTLTSPITTTNPIPTVDPYIVPAGTRQHTLKLRKSL